MLAIPERNRAAGFPAEVVDYAHWNAHSVFFNDPAGNVVEYIARHDLKNTDTSPFSWADILYVSEIGLVVDDAAEMSQAVGKMTAVAPYKGGNTDFMAMGDEVRPSAPDETWPEHRLHEQRQQRRARVSHRRQHPWAEGGHPSVGLAPLPLDR